MCVCVCLCETDQLVSDGNDTRTHGFKQNLELEQSMSKDLPADTEYQVCIMSVNLPYSCLHRIQSYKLKTIGVLS